MGRRSRLRRAQFKAGGWPDWEADSDSSDLHGDDEDEWEDVSDGHSDDGYASGGSAGLGCVCGCRSCHALGSCAWRHAGAIITSLTHNNNWDACLNTGRECRACTSRRGRSSVRAAAKRCVARTDVIGKNLGIDPRSNATGFFRSCVLSANPDGALLTTVPDSTVRLRT